MTTTILNQTVVLVVFPATFTARPEFANQSTEISLEDLHIDGALTKQAVMQGVVNHFDLPEDSFSNMEVRLSETSVVISEKPSFG